MASVDAAAFETHLRELRRGYVEATLRQRLSVARQRIQNPERDPNRLIAFVSAAEGFARALCLNTRAPNRTERWAIYPEYWKRGTEDLITEYLAAKGCSPPPEYFGKDLWLLFHYAVQYRNLLAHECTYLGQDKTPALIEACRTVIKGLAAKEGLNADDF
jgi:hypothetical protein